MHHIKYWHPIVPQHHCQTAHGQNVKHEPFICRCKKPQWLGNCYKKRKWKILGLISGDCSLNFSVKHHNPQEYIEFSAQHCWSFCFSHMYICDITFIECKIRTASVIDFFSPCLDAQWRSNSYLLDEKRVFMLKFSISAINMHLYMKHVFAQKGLGRNRTLFSHSSQTSLSAREACCVCLNVMYILMMLLSGISHWINACPVIPEVSNEELTMPQRGYTLTVIRRKWITSFFWSSGDLRGKCHVPTRLMCIHSCSSRCFPLHTV